MEIYTCTYRDGNKKPGDKKFNIQSSRTEQTSEITMTPALYCCTTLDRIGS